MRLRSAKVGASMSRPTKANLKANCAGLQAEPQAQRFSREMRPRRRRRVARGEAEPRSGRKRPRDSATHCRRQPKTSLRPPCAPSVANQLCLATKGAQRGTKVFRVGAPPQTTQTHCRRRIHLPKAIAKRRLRWCPKHLCASRYCPPSAARYARGITPCAAL